MEETLKNIFLALTGIGKELEGIRENLYDLKMLAKDEEKIETVTVDHTDDEPGD